MIPFQKIPDASKTTGLSQYYLRNGCKDGSVPHIKSGTVYLVNGVWKVLYLSPGYLEEYAEEMGLTMPKDIPAALEAAGLHPVNLEELKHGR